jgi:hypothetical protein
MNAVAWQGPPDDILGCPVPVHRLVARTDHAVVALHQALAYPEGCCLTLHAAVRGAAAASVWDNLQQGSLGEDPYVTPTDPDLKFGVRFPDGSKATTVDNAFHGWSPPTDRPEPPMLIEAGSESSSNERSFRGSWQLWLWPLPPPVPFEFVIEWQTMGIPTTATTLDGAAIALAAGKALPYWP